MKIGKLYEIKEFFWFLYPSKDIAVTAAPAPRYDAAAAAAAADRAAYLSNRFKCKVSYIKPSSIFCLLEKDEKLLKILSTNGELGWIIDDWCKDDIEEVNQ